MTGVQLIGKEAVLARYDSFSAESWALFQGKQFIVGGQGREDLEQWLTDFKNTGSTATYMIRVYDCADTPISSTANGDHLACVSFKLVDMYNGQGIAGHSNQVIERLGAIEKQLKEKEDDTDSDDSGGLNSIIMGWLSDPVKLGQVAGAIRQMMGGPGAVPVQTIAATGTPLQTISGVGNSAVTAGNDTEAKLTRIAGALDILEKYDLKLVEHLEKLAKLAADDPLIFTAIISKLDAL